MLQGFRWEKHSANAAFPSLFVLLGHEGEQLSRNYHLSAPLSPDAPEGKKKDSCQEVSALKNARDAQGGAAGWRCVLTAEETRTQPTEHCSRLSFNAFCPVIKKLHRLQLNTENMIHPVSKLRPLHPSRPKRAAEAEARRSLQGGLCEAPSLPGLSPFFLNTGDRTLFVLRRHGGGGKFRLVGVTGGAAGELPVAPCELPCGASGAFILLCLACHHLPVPRNNVDVYRSLSPDPLLLLEENKSLCSMHWSADESRWSTADAEGKLWLLLLLQIKVTSCMQRCKGFLQ